MPKWVENCLSNMFGIRLYLSKSAILESFSIPHTLAYSVEAVQEANLATRYNPIFWECACLSVDAGSSGVSMGEAEDDEEDDDYTEQEQEKSVSTTNYGKVGKAVARALFRGAKVVPPTINEAEKDFYPNISNNTIVHSLLAISGVNIEFADKILANRPYTSIEDFMDKIEPTNIQMLNLALEKCFGESAQPDVYNVDAQGNAIFEYPFIYSEPPMKNLDAQAKVTAALESGDTSALNAEEKGYYDQIAAYLDGDLLGWANYMNYGPSSSMAVINDYVSDGRLQSDQYFGADTEGMTRSQTILDQTQLQDFTQIIMGADISLFDDYVESWYSLGGQQITDEVNEWYSER